MNNRVKNSYKKAIEKAYNLLQTEVEIHVRTERAPVAIDPIYDEPVNHADDGYIKKIVRVQGMFTWFKGYPLDRLPPGTERKEQGYLHVRLTDVLKYPGNLSGPTIFDDTEKVVVDGIECKVISTPRKVGIPEPYDVIVTLERSQ